MIEPFVVFTLPRSRSLWTAHYLSYGGRRVGHDLLVECESLAHFEQQFARGIDGTVETGAMLGWRVIRARVPRVRFLTIRRPIAEVRASLGKFGIEPAEGELETRDGLLDVIERVPGTISFRSDELSDPTMGKRLFEHCLGLPFDPEWHARTSATKIEIDMQWRLDRLEANRPRLEAMKIETMIENSRLMGGACPGFQ